MVEIGGDFVRLGQWHCCCSREASSVPMALVDSDSDLDSPTVGNVLGMMPRSMHASLLRKSLSVLTVT